MIKIIKKLAIVNMAIIILFCLCSFTFAFGPSGNKIYEGIDVSGYQGDINYSRVKKAGIEIVYIKATEGDNYVDSHFERNYKNAKENGLKVGFYHYLTARTEEQARHQAQFFVSKLSKKQVDCKLAMDFESFGNLSKTQINRIAEEFLKTVERLSGKKAIVYSNTYDASYIFSRKCK